MELSIDASESARLGDIVQVIFSHFLTGIPTEQAVAAFP
jgi:hypothetical protein